MLIKYRKKVLFKIKGYNCPAFLLYLLWVTTKPGWIPRLHASYPHTMILRVTAGATPTQHLDSKVSACPDVQFNSEQKVSYLFKPKILHCIPLDKTTVCNVNLIFDFSCLRKVLLSSESLK